MNTVDERSPLRWAPPSAAQPQTRNFGSLTAPSPQRNWATSGQQRNSDVDAAAGWHRRPALVVTLGALTLCVLVVALVLPLAPRPSLGEPVGALLQQQAPVFQEPSSRGGGGGRGGLVTTLRVAPLRVALRLWGREHAGRLVRYTTRAFEGSVPGPTLRVRRGEVLRIELRNALGADSDAAGRFNELRWPNHTVLHAHGLHVSPSGHGDNMFKTVLPGASRSYVYAVPRSHPTGTFWLHAHAHGSSALQTAYSLAAALIVEDEASELPRLLRHVHEHVAIVQALDVGTSSGRDALKMDEESRTLLPAFLFGSERSSQW
jgi:FtsP/CotA-like multicopper oxidase with cupredoxin domain